MVVGLIPPLSSIKRERDALLHISSEDMLSLKEILDGFCKNSYHVVGVLVFWCSGRAYENYCYR